MKRSQKYEFVWLGISLALTSLLIYFFFKNSEWPQGMYEIHFGDAFYSFSPLLLFGILFFGISFTIFYIRCFKTRFCTQTANYILLISGIVLIACLLLINIGSPSFSIGHTIYPSLSNLGEREPPEIPQQYSRGILEYTLLTVTLIIILLVVYAAFLLGRNISKEITAS